jgi:hypothetical protein
VLVAHWDSHGSITWPRAVGELPADIPSDLLGGMQSLATLQQQLLLVVAKPIARPVKQVFSARNYSLATTLRPGFVRLRHVVKRRIRVNRGFIIGSKAGRSHVRVIPANEAPSEDTGQMITLGMLCEGQRKGRLLIGIVAAIHSTGRLTLLVPNAVREDMIDWCRIIVSPRQHLRALSTDPVIFLHAPRSASGDQDAMAIGT